MSQPGRAGPPPHTPITRSGQPSAPLRVVSERLTDEEARAEAAAAASPTSPLPTPSASRPPESFPAALATPAAPVLAPSALPVLAPRRRHFGTLWRLVFARRRAGRHRPETTPPHSWSMVSPQRRRSGRRWGRR